MRVLVIEDEASIRLVLGAALQAEGCEAVLVDTGVRGLEHLDDEPFDVVLLDVMLPDMDGLTVLSRLRAGGSRGSRVGVVILSALIEPAQRTEALRRGADAYVTKPFDVEALLEVLREVAARDGARRQAARTAALSASRRRLARSA